MTIHTSKRGKEWTQRLLEAFRGLLATLCRDWWSLQINFGARDLKAVVLVWWLFPVNCCSQLTYLFLVCEEM